ncbi:hypothetical protein SISNIDRAFT_497406 [Sistotremastrum niveocremeum HHB9708]|uniref:Uncharacterized protein n=1 Tax=Sistotremastrum niveocremeum HHB9708 TaxID=1314777 RepID=A0A164QPV7_9AGAM|nr:hypothetical protein SISNIDRAFT_497406 [Sistotremastrum niveocremeum HHB9708]
MTKPSSSKHDSSYFSYSRHFLSSRARYIRLISQIARKSQHVILNLAKPRKRGRRYPIRSYFLGEDLLSGSLSHPTCLGQRAQKACVCMHAQAGRVNIVSGAAIAPTGVPELDLEMKEELGLKFGDAHNNRLVEGEYQDEEVRKLGGLSWSWLKDGALVGSKR